MNEPETQIREVGFHSREGQEYISGASALSFYCSLLLKGQRFIFWSCYLLSAGIVTCWIQFSSVAQNVWLFVIPWTAAHQVSLSIVNSWSLLGLMSIELVMPSNLLILCCPLLFLLSIFPIIRVFSRESGLCITWPKYWSVSISPFNEHSGLISFRIDWFPLHAVQGTLKNKYVNSRGLRKRKTFPLLSCLHTTFFP